jgi:hypothetical protein
MELKNELNDEIDKILKIPLSRGNLNVFDCTKGKLGETGWRVCKVFGFISTDGSYAELTEKGLEVLRDGGIKKHLEKNKNDKILDSTIKTLTSNRLKYDVWYNLLYTLAGGMLGFMSSLLLPDNSKEYIKELNKAAFDKVELNDSFQKRLNDKNTLIFSLQKELDSLKTSASD